MYQHGFWITAATLKPFLHKESIRATFIFLCCHYWGVVLFPSFSKVCVHYRTRKGEQHICNILNASTHLSDKLRFQCNKNETGQHLFPIFSYGWNTRVPCRGAGGQCGLLFMLYLVGILSQLNVFFKVGYIAYEGHHTNGIHCFFRSSNGN